MEFSLPLFISSKRSSMFLLAKMLVPLFPPSCRIICLQRDRMLKVQLATLLIPTIL